MAAYCFAYSSILGDADAMQEFAQCWLDGVGLPKDKLKAARWFREAEAKGKVLMGMSWIHKKKNGGNE